MKLEQRYVLEICSSGEYKHAMGSVNARGLIEAPRDGQWTGDFEPRGTNTVW